MTGEIYTICGRLAAAAHKRLPLIWSVGKAIVLFVLGVLIYRQVSDYHDQIGDISLLLSGSWAWPGIALVSVLMIANWVLETTKWRMLLSPFVSLPLGAAVRSVMSGISLALVTPGRVGEYGGRLLGVPAESRAKAVMANGVGSIAQNICNIGCGLLGMIAYAVIFLQMNHSTLVATTVIALFVLLVMALVFFRLDVVAMALQAIGRGSKLAKLANQADFLKEYDTSLLSKVLGISLVRYLVYCLQYVILVMILGVTDDPMHALIGVSVIFFVQSGLPLPPMLSVLARGEMAIWIWSVFTTQVVAILAATFMLWMINLVVPALVGAVIIWRSDLVAR